MIQFGKFLIIGLCALVSVSCAIPRSPEPQTEPEPSTEIDKPQPPAPTVSVPPPSEPSEPTPPERPTVVLRPPPVAQLPASLVSLRDKTIVPGGIAWVSLSSQSETPPEIMYQQRRVMVLRDEEQWVALVGIPLSAKLGKHAVIDQQTGKRYSFQVKYKKYKTQRLKVKKRQVNLQRIKRERKLIRAALATPWQTTSTSPLPLMQPVQGRFSSSFGLRRYFNGQRRNPHTGLDIAAPQGTPIAAAAAGKVLNIGDYFYTGNTIIIDHGQSVVTLYAHLNTIAVETDQMVERGEIIGTVGKTGRVTGPHLHWGVSLNNTMIDPMLVME
jgi:murein DD-endopeptidase MepM/ murein hydrolase activator NlpD